MSSADLTPGTPADRISAASRKIMTDYPTPYVAPVRGHRVPTPLAWALLGNALVWVAVWWAVV